MHRLGIVVNPMSGRDVRRVAARASTTTHHDKQQQVTRLVLAALEQGVDEIFLLKEPFRINERAVENLPERDRVTLLQLPLTHSAQDTVNMTRAMWDAGCRTFVVLGGDGTSRIVAGEHPDAAILPLSTGTNNVFPYMIEPSVAGAAAGLVATGKVDASNCRRCKRIHIDTGSEQAIALVDAVLLKDDYLGSYLPFEAQNIASVFLAIARPDTIGMSPIGGFIMPSDAHDDFGVHVDTGTPAITNVRVPLSAGLYGDLAIRSVQRMELDAPATIEGPGILAFDGDRSIKLEPGETATITMRRDGPRLVEPWKVMASAVEHGIFSRPPPA